MSEFADVVHPDLATHANAFLAANPGVATRAGLAVTAGAYVEAAGGAFSEGGLDVAVRHKLKIAAQNASVAGSQVDFGGVALDSGTSDVGLVVLEELGDPVVDDAETLGRLLAPYGDEGTGWAAAIAGDPERAAHFGAALAETALPPSSPSDDVAVLRAYLARHFTYAGDPATYVVKWAGAGRTFPGDVSPEYRTTATREQILARDRFYCMSVLSADGGAVETVTSITLVPDRAEPELTVVYRADRPGTVGVDELCFFYADAGSGITVPDSARGTLRPGLSNLGLDRAAASVVAELAATSETAVVGNDRIRVSAVVRPGSFAGTIPTLPDGVVYQGGEPGPATADDADDTDTDEIADSQQDHVRFFDVPADKLVELAALEDIVVLQPVGVARPGVDAARGHIDHAGLLANLGTAQGGNGVVIGIVDTGIDPAHPAFAGRIHSVWDQTAAADPAHPPPPGTGNNFGQVWSTAADIAAGSVDTNGHGTHVAGIAAGAPGGAYVASGVAPAAQLVIVRTDFDEDHVRRGVEWCFRQAGASPCVVNLSLWGAHTGHDGVDNFALAVRRTFRRPNVSGSGYTWLPGRVVVGIAGNGAASRGHTDISPLAPNAVGSAALAVAGRGAPPVPVTPVAHINLFARPLPAAARGARVDVRVRVGVGAGAAATPWFTFAPNGAPQSVMLGTTLVRVVNGPAAGSALGLVFTQHQHVDIRLVDPGNIPAGQYTIDVRNRSAVDIEVDMYIPATIMAGGGSPVFFTGATQRRMIASPASAHGVLRVGSSVNRASWRPVGAPADGSGDTTNQVATFDPATNLVNGSNPAVVHDVAFTSNPGPVRGSSRTITILTPGDGVLSGRSSNGAGAPAAPNDIDALTTQMSGTSMAAPVVTGVVACLLASHPRWTAKQISERIERAVHPPPAGWDAVLFGPGRLDAAQIVV